MIKWENGMKMCDGVNIAFWTRAATELPFHVYKPFKVLFGGKEVGRDTYGVPFFREDVPYDIRDLLIYPRRRPGKRIAGLAKAKGRIEVICDDIDELVRELARLDARNVSRDRIFKGRDVQVVAQVMDLEGTGMLEMMHTPRRPGASLVLIPKTVSIVL